MSKKIIILNGSPRANGNTAALIREFTAGAEGAGNCVTVFNVAKMNIRGCVGCLAGGSDLESPCTQKDDMELIYAAYRETGVVVLASPLYFWGFSGQLKIAIDRLFAIMEAGVWDKPAKECAMLIACEADDRANWDPMADYYRKFTGFVGWKDLGSVFAGGVLKAGEIEGHAALADARKLGASIKQ